MWLDNLKVTAVAILLMLAGCGTQPTGSMETETTQLETTTPPASNISTTSTPKRPQEFTEENVVQYVSQLAEARTHNQLLRENAVSISVNCDASLRAMSADGYYLENICRGYADYKDSHVDLGVTPTAYFVSNDEILRIDDSLTEIAPSDVAFSSNNSSKEPTPPYEQAEIRIYNFDSSRHNISISVQYTGDRRNKSVTIGEFGVRRMNGLIQEGGVEQMGEYEVSIRLDSERIGRYSWNVTEPSETHVFSIFISTEGDIFISSN